MLSKFIIPRMNARKIEQNPFRLNGTYDLVFYTSTHPWPPQKYCLQKQMNYWTSFLPQAIHEYLHWKFLRPYWIQFQHSDTKRSDKKSYVRRCNNCVFFTCLHPPTISSFELWPECTCWLLTIRAIKWGSGFKNLPSCICEISCKRRRFTKISLKSHPESFLASDFS